MKNLIEINYNYYNFEKKQKKKINESHVIITK